MNEADHRIVRPTNAEIDRHIVALREIVIPIQDAKRRDRNEIECRFDAMPYQVRLDLNKRQQERNRKIEALYAAIAALEKRRTVAA